MQNVCQTEYQRELERGCVVPLQARLDVEIPESEADSLFRWLTENEFNWDSENESDESDRKPRKPVRMPDPSKIGCDIKTRYGDEGYYLYRDALEFCPKYREAKREAADKMVADGWSSFDREYQATDVLLIDLAAEAHACGWQPGEVLAAEIDRLRDMQEEILQQERDADEAKLRAECDAKNAEWKSRTETEHAKLAAAGNVISLADYRESLLPELSMKQQALRLVLKWSVERDRAEAEVAYLMYTFEKCPAPSESNTHRPDLLNEAIAERAEAELGLKEAKCFLAQVKAREDEVAELFRLVAEKAAENEAAVDAALKADAEAALNAKSIVFVPPVAPGQGTYPVPQNSLLTRAAGQFAPPEYAETEIADRFVKDYGAQISHVKSLKQWRYWTGAQWCIDETGYVADLVRKHCQNEAALCKGTPGYTDAIVRSISGERTKNNILSLVSTDQRIATRADDWDSESYLIGVPDGVVDLRTGTLRAALPGDRITKSCAVAPDGDCPQWREFLAQAAGGNTDLVDYLQRMCGYFLTGDTREESLHFAHGPGGAGKGTFAHAVSGILANYHVAIEIATLTESRNDRHPAELAVLKGARLVTCSETERGKRWAESRIKELTGCDTISARYMGGNPFNFLPTFKIFVSGNHRPHLRPDSAMRRRFQLLPFRNVAAKADNELGEKLRKEWPGILAWMIEGCLKWQRDGLMSPSIVRDASKEYMDEESQDCMAMWLAECCEADPAARTPHATLYASYRAYAERSGERPIVSAMLGKELKELRYTAEHTRLGRVVVGLRLKSQPPFPAGV